MSFARSVALALRDASVEEVNGIIPLELPEWIARENCYRAAHHGLSAEYIIDAKGNLRPLRQVIARMIEFCRPVAGKSGEATGLQLAADLLSGTPGYERQLLAYEESSSPRAVVRMLTDALVEGTPALAQAL